MVKLGMAVVLAALAAACSGEKKTEIPEAPATLRLDSRLKDHQGPFVQAALEWSERFPGCPVTVKGFFGSEDPSEITNAIILDENLTHAASGDVAAAKWSYLQSSMIVGPAALAETPERLSVIALHELVHARGLGHMPTGIMS